MEKTKRAIQILDVRRQCRGGSTAKIPDQIVQDLDASFNMKSLPTILLYDERGLRLYDQITTDAPEYYLFGAEEEILKTHASQIVKVMHSRTGAIVPGEIILELGAGALRKTSHILGELATLAPTITGIPSATYFALDLEERELQRTLTELEMSDVGSTMIGKIDAKGMLGTYEDGLDFIMEGGLRSVDKSSFPLERYRIQTAPRERSPSSSSSSERDSTDTEATSPSTPGQPPLHLMFLGSSLGNFDRGEDVEFLRSLPLRPGFGDTLLLGLDHDNGREEIELAYNDHKGYTKEFIMNGLMATGKALGDEELFDLNNWKYVNAYDKDERRHEAFYQCVRAHQITIPGSKQEIRFLEDELVKIEMSYKYSETDAFTLFTQANLRPIQRWVDSTSRYSLWLLERPPFMFPLLTSLAASSEFSTNKFGAPTMEDWENLWSAWDFITLRMIPPSMLFQKPIDLRHICLFYIGHIPTFLDIHFSRLLQEPHTEPEEFKYIFERGIDPNVDDPTQCHAHSEVPQKDEDWPSLRSILGFRLRVRERVRRLYTDISTGKIPLTRKIGRVLFMTFEHEGLHAETLLYMLLQRAGTGTIAPPDFTPPPWESLLETWNDAAPKTTSSTVVINATTVTLGIDDIESEDTDPAKSQDVAEHVFGWDNESPKREVGVDTFKIEWRPVTNGEFFEFYRGAGQGKVKLPASWVQKGDGKIQVRTMYGPVSMRVAWEWPVLTCYDNLSIYASVKGGRIPTEPELRVFLDKFESGYEGGANTGFRNWHPVPATTGGEKYGGRGHNGGVWEWTSTVFDSYDGFRPSDLYPGYSADFFDGAHQVVLGGSFATIPHIAERRSVRNWYQRNYPYAWISARVVYDV